jgi:hypothetical protein
MHPKLKDNPREWQKFTAVMALVAALICMTLHKRGVLSVTALGWAVGVLLLVVLISLARPHWFRKFYRRGMVFSYHVGQTMGVVLLCVFFLTVVTPLGIFLRLLGKDLLELKRNPAAKSYWQPARNNPHFDRMF